MGKKANLKSYKIWSVWHSKHGRSMDTVENQCLAVTEKWKGMHRCAPDDNMTMETMMRTQWQTQYGGCEQSRNKLTTLILFQQIKIP